MHYKLMNKEIGIKMKTYTTILTLLTVFLTSTAIAGNVTIPNTFSSGTKAVAAEVNDNFTAVKNAVDDNQSQIDNLTVNANTAGDMQYWNGSAWVVLPAPTTSTTALLRFCTDKPSWDPCFAVGDTGPAGGIVIHVNADGVTGLEAAPADVAGTFVWGCAATATGITDPAIGAGESNTSSMISAGCAGAADAADTFSFGGFDDWYLPSKDELALLYSQRATIGGFTTGSYWSSTENGATASWFQDFSDGTQDFTSKTTAYNVRPIRSF